MTVSAQQFLATSKDGKHQETGLKHEEGGYF
jgi:hypothetical protein